MKPKIRTSKDDNPKTGPEFHVICERDVGLFSLIQQVLSNIPWALQEQRIPVVYFGDRCCYWTPSGYHDRDTVWEYYFEPLVTEYSAAAIANPILQAIRKNFPDYNKVGYWHDEKVFVSNHFGDHPRLKGKSMTIPYSWDDPNPELRQRASRIIRDYVQPRPYLQDKVNRFFRRHMEGTPTIGVHIRGTDATSKQECTAHRRGSLSFPSYIEALQKICTDDPSTQIFLATDDESSLATIREAFPHRVIAYDSIRHAGGKAAGKGPTGGLIPAYIAGNRNRAARNGEEAVIEYLLLARCKMLVHNGSGLARTVLLKDPDMPHVNIHRGNRGSAYIRTMRFYKVKRFALLTLQRMHLID